MGEEHRLCRLHMSVAGHDRIKMRVGQADQRALYAQDGLVEVADPAKQIEPQVGLDLVVALTSGV